MGRFGHENGPFWMLAGAVLVLFFLPLGPFWRWAVLVGSRQMDRQPDGHRTMAQAAFMHSKARQKSRLFVAVGLNKSIYGML